MSCNCDVIGLIACHSLVLTMSSHTSQESVTEIPIIPGSDVVDTSPPPPIPAPVDNATPTRCHCCIRTYHRVPTDNDEDNPEQGNRWERCCLFVGCPLLIVVLSFVAFCGLIFVSTNVIDDPERYLNETDFNVSVH
jgi:hypothetical protein